MRQPPVSPTSTMSAQEPAATETRLHGRWLLIARVSWIVDLNELCEQLLAVVQETMQPAHVSLWLRPPEPHSEALPQPLEPHSL